METTNNNDELAPEEKVEREVDEAVPDDLGYGWFKWHFVVYPGLFAFTFCLVVGKDIYHAVDLLLTLIVAPFFMIYAVATGAWIEDGYVVEEESTDKGFVVEDDDGYESSGIETDEYNLNLGGSVDKIDDPEIPEDEPEETDQKETSDDSDFVEIDIQ